MENTYPTVTDFCALTRSSDGHQVLVVIEEGDDGKVHLRMSSVVDEVMSSITVGPLPASVVNEAIATFDTERADDIRGRLVKNYEAWNAKGKPNGFFEDVTQEGD